MNCLMSKRRNEEESVIVLSKKTNLRLFIIYFYDICVPIKAGPHGECE